MMTVFLAPLKGSSPVFGEMASDFPYLGTNSDSSPEVEITSAQVKI